MSHEDPKGDPVATLEALVDLTPEPPASDADPEEVLQAGEELIASRASFIDWLRAHLGPTPHLNPAAAPYLAALRERDLRWEASLKRAQHELGQRLVGLRRLARY
jgi:hypothetical protein